MSFITDAIVVKINALWRTVTSQPRYDRPTIPLHFDSNNDPQSVTPLTPFPVIDTGLLDSQMIIPNPDEPAKYLLTSATSGATTVVHANTKRVVLIATSDCWISLGSAPVAAVGGADSFLLPAKVPFFPVKVTGGITKIAVIQDSAAGKLSILESL